MIKYGLSLVEEEEWIEPHMNNEMHLNILIEGVPIKTINQDMLKEALANLEEKLKQSLANQNYEVCDKLHAQIKFCKKRLVK